MSRNYSSDPKGRRFISLAALAVTVVLLLLLNILRLYAEEKFPGYLPDAPAMPVRVISALMMTAAALYVVFIVILLPMWYKSLRYVINDKEIISYSGIFSRTYRIMKLSSVQHAVRISAPLSGYTGFNLIILKALGGNMPLLFLSDKDCGEILELFREKCEEKPRGESGKYIVEYSPEDSSYVYSDSSAIFSSQEISDIAEDFDSVRQLSFDELGSEQMTFSDIESGKDEKQ